MPDQRKSQRQVYLETLKGLQTLVEMQQTVIAEAMEKLSGRPRPPAGKKRSPRSRRGLRPQPKDGVTGDS